MNSNLQIFASELGRAFLRPGTQRGGRECVKREFRASNSPQPWLLGPCSRARHTAVAGFVNRVFGSALLGPARQATSAGGEVPPFAHAGGLPETLRLIDFSANTTSSAGTTCEHKLTFIDQNQCSHEFQCMNQNKCSRELHQRTDRKIYQVENTAGGAGRRTCVQAGSVGE